MLLLTTSHAVSGSPLYSAVMCTCYPSAIFPVNTLVLLLQASHLQEKDNFALLEQARIIYSAGFFLTASAESMLVAAKHAAANNKIYCVNISAPFLLQVWLGSCITLGLSNSSLWTAQFISTILCLCVMPLPARWS